MIMTEQEIQMEWMVLLLLLLLLLEKIILMGFGWNDSSYWELEG